MPEGRPSRFQRRTPQDPLTRLDESLAFLASEQTWRPPDWFAQIALVLVETTDPVNVGGVVRAMANTGFQRLRLVNPAAVVPDAWHVIGIAHYTQHIVESTQVFPNLLAGVSDAQFVLGLTGKHYRVQRNALPLGSALARVAQAAQAGQTVALVFGREDIGLTNAQLDVCQAVTTIPTDPAYSSLNLAQAALLVLYLLFLRAGGDQQPLRPPRKSAPPASVALLADLFADLERALDAIDFLHSRSRVSTMRSLRSALYRARLDVREASLLRAVAIEVRRYLHRRGLLAEVGPVGAGRSGDRI